MNKYEEPIMEITILDTVGTLIIESTGGNELDTPVPSSSNVDEGYFG